MLTATTTLLVLLLLLLLLLPLPTTTWPALPRHDAYHYDANRRVACMTHCSFRYCYHYCYCHNHHCTVAANARAPCLRPSVPKPKSSQLLLFPAAQGALNIFTQIYIPNDLFQRSSSDMSLTESERLANAWASKVDIRRCTSLFNALL